MMSMTLINSMALIVLRLVKWVRPQLAKRVESLFSIRRLGASAASDVTSVVIGTAHENLKQTA